MIGGLGSLMLDLYGWESVFYVSGLLSVLWAYCMWKYLLKGEGMYRIREHKHTHIYFDWGQYDFNVFERSVWCIYMI